MIGWVDEQCKIWGGHKRWLVYGTHDGYPPLSLLGRLILEGPGAGEHTFKSRELVYDAPQAYVLVQCALYKMAATSQMAAPYAVVWAHYFFEGRAKNKAPKMDMPLRMYWQHLHAAHAFIIACEPGDVSREVESCARNLACA